MTANTDPHATLRRLFLTLFLRGRSPLGGKKEKAPTSLHQKLTWTLLLYAALGFVVLVFLRQPLFGYAAYLHSMTFVFIGMFVASSSGEVLFCREEADILLHRPITPMALLWAKVRVMVEVSLWLAGAFNLAGLMGGYFAMEHGLRFVIVHVVSTALLALFTAGCVVMVYLLCLKLFGRERLESLMTLTQMLVAIAFVLAGQLPNLLQSANLKVSASAWWVALIPPAWFAGLDDALAGQASLASWRLAALSLVVTALTTWLAFGRLAEGYQQGLQTMNETKGWVRATPSGRPLLHRIVSLPPLSWWLRDPVTRASFLMTIRYLVRDRDVKLRVYPTLAPYLILPIIYFLQGQGKPSGSLAAAAMAATLGLLPIVVQTLLQHSNQWQASEIFRRAPLAGPGSLYDGCQRAVVFMLVLPILSILAVVAGLSRGDPTLWMLLLPGLIAIPVTGLLPLGRGWVPPLSQPLDESKSVRQGFQLVGAMLGSMLLGGLVVLARHLGVITGFLLVEMGVVAVAYVFLRRSLFRSPWPEENG